MDSNRSRVHPFSCSLWLHHKFGPSQSLIFANIFAICMDNFHKILIQWIKTSTQKLYPRYCLSVSCKRKTRKHIALKITLFFPLLLHRAWFPVPLISFLLSHPSCHGPVMAYETLISLFQQYGCECVVSREGRCNRLVGQTNQTGRQDLHIIRLSTQGFPLSKVKQNPALQSLLLFSNQSNWTQITVSFHFAGYAWKNKELSSHWDVRASGGLMEKWNDDRAMKVNIKCNSCDFPFKPFFDETW